MLRKETYKFLFKVGTVTVYTGITKNINQKEVELINLGVYTIFGNQKLYWKNGYLVQIGDAVSHESALKWEQEKNELISV